jgi:hypothetical protein
MENQRIRLSKTMLKNALIELLQQKSIFTCSFARVVTLLFVNG